MEDIIVCVENHKESTKTLLDFIYKSDVFLYINSNNLKNEIFTFPFKKSKKS